MPKRLYCEDVFPGCDFVAHGSSEDEVLFLAVQHARAKHSLGEADWEILARFSGAIQRVDE